MKEQRHIIFQGLSHSGIQSVRESKSRPWLAGADLFPSSSRFSRDCDKPWGFETTCESNLLMRKHLLYAMLKSLGNAVMVVRTGIRYVSYWALQCVTSLQPRGVFLL